MNKHIKHLALFSSSILICLILFFICRYSFFTPKTFEFSHSSETEFSSDIESLFEFDTSSDVNYVLEAENSPNTESLSEYDTSSNIDDILEAENSSNTEYLSESDISESGIFMEIPEDIVYYKNDFFYHSLTDSIKEKITGVSYPATESEIPALSVNAVNIIKDSQTPAISYDDLCFMNVLYYDFNGEIQTGELICNKKIANDLIEIFYELYLNEYPIEKISLIDEYNGDDTASMLDNNTSCFNYRVVDGTNSLSKHAVGCAIDINPFYNPYVVFDKNNTGKTYIYPEGSEIYADRSQNFPYKIDENDLCYKLFKMHGFAWGGYCKSCKDYQHFEKTVK